MGRGKWVGVLEHCTGDNVEGHLRRQMAAGCRCGILEQ